MDCNNQSGFEMAIYIPGPICPIPAKPGRLPRVAWRGKVIGMEGTEPSFIIMLITDSCRIRLATDTGNVYIDYPGNRTRHVGAIQNFLTHIIGVS